MNRLILVSTNISAPLSSKSRSHLRKADPLGTLYPRIVKRGMKAQQSAQRILASKHMPIAAPLILELEKPTALGLTFQNLCNHLPSICPRMTFKTTPNPAVQSCLYRQASTLSQMATRFMLLIRIMDTWTLKWLTILLILVAQRPSRATATTTILHQTRHTPPPRKHMMMTKMCPQATEEGNL